VCQRKTPGRALPRPYEVHFMLLSLLSADLGRKNTAAMDMMEMLASLGIPLDTRSSDGHPFPRSRNRCAPRQRRSTRLRGELRILPPTSSLRRLPGRSRITSSKEELRLEVPSKGASPPRRRSACSCAEPPAGHTGATDHREEVTAPGQAAKFVHGYAASKIERHRGDRIARDHRMRTTAHDHVIRRGRRPLPPTQEARRVLA